MSCRSRRRRRAYWAEPLERRVLLATLAGTVYNDLNADGARNPFTDTGLGGWTVYIDANENGVLDGNELNTASAASGAWSITSAGFRTRDTYHVRVVNQSTWRPTEPAAGEYAVSFASVSDTVAGLDFGQTRRALMQGTVFEDTNEDGTWDREPVQAGRTVFADANNNGILDAGEVSAVTDANGDYALSPAAGTYTVRQVQQAGWWQTAPSPPTAGHVVTLSNAQTVSARHFGNIVATVDLLGVGFAVTSAFDPVPGDGRIEVLYQVRNNGTADSAGFRVDFYLSDDGNITTSDTLLRSIAQGAVPRHGTVDRTTTITLPRPDPLRSDNQYYVGMIIDSEADVAETNETNNANQGVLADRYPVSSEADLPMPVDNTNVLAKPIAVGGQAAGFIGDEWIGGYDQDIYRLPVTAGHRLSLTVDGLSTPALIRLYNGSWSLREISTGTLEYEVPSSDTYHVVISSGGNGLNDPRRLNGRVEGPTGPYTLTVDASGFDLHSASLSVDGAVPGPLHATLRVRTTLGAFNEDLIRDFDVTLYLSDDEQFSAADIFLTKTRLTRDHYSPSEDLSSGSFVSSVDFSLPPVDPFRTDNEYWIGFLVDSAGEFPERHETNNSSAGEQRGSEHALPQPVNGQTVAGIPLHSGHTTSGDIGGEWIGPYDLDVFTGTANPGETIHFDVDRTGLALDGYLRLYDEDWNLLAANDNGAAPGELITLDPFLRYTFPAGGRYWVVVGGAGNHASNPRLLAGRSAASTGPYDFTATFEPAGPVTGVVFDDANGNGVRDGAEPGLAGWTVYLDVFDDRLFIGDPHAFTGADGTFSFAGLRPGTYPLRHVIKPGWIATTPSGGTYTVTVASGQPAGPYLFGDLQAATATGVVFDDVNRDGAQGAGEAGLPGRMVYADLNHNGRRDLTTLSIDAVSVPTPLFSGSRFNLDLPPQGPLVVADLDVGLNFQSREIEIYLVGPAAQVLLVRQPAGGNLNFYDVTLDDEASFQLPSSSISGRFLPRAPISVFDSVAPAGRWFLAVPASANANTGVLIRWTLAFTLSEPFATTDAQGRYTLGSLMPGLYTVEVEPHPDRIATSPAAGGHDVTLAEAQTASGLDFGQGQRRLQVTGQHLFYNNSDFDGRSPAIGAADDEAIASDKSFVPAALAPAAANVTGYSKGINGVMVDVYELPTAPTLSHFSFKVPSPFNPSLWLDAPAPTGFAVRDLPGGDHARRVTFTWPDNLLRNTWLQIGVLANAATRRPAPDVSYIANLVGETADALTPTRVSAADLAATRAASSRARVTLSNRFDHNRDGFVNILDQQIVRGAIGRVLPILVPPSSASAASASAARGVRPLVRAGWTAGLLDESK